MVYHFEKFDFDKLNVNIKTRHIRIMTNKAGKIASKFFIKTLNKQGFYNGDNFQRYQPVQAKYLTWKRSRGYSSKTMHQKGNLKKGFVKGLVSNSSYRIYNKMPYAYYHQVGAGNLPERPIFYTPQVLIDEISEMIKEELNLLIQKQLR